MLNIAGTNRYLIHWTKNNEKKKLRREYVWHPADVRLKENVEIRRPTSLESELKIKVFFFVVKEKKAELEV